MGGTSLELEEFDKLNKVIFERGVVYVVSKRNENDLFFLLYLREATR